MPGLSAVNHLQNKPGGFFVLLPHPSSVFGRGFPLTHAAEQAELPMQPPGTHKDAQTEHGDSWSLAQGQQQEQQGRAQLHQVEKVVVCKEVGSECFGIFGVSEELVIIFSFLGQQE